MVGIDRSRLKTPRVACADGPYSSTYNGSSQSTRALGADGPHPFTPWVKLLLPRFGADTTGQSDRRLVHDLCGVEQPGSSSAS